MPDDLEQYAAALTRREKRLSAFLRYRGWVGLVLLGLGAVGFGLAVAFLLAAVGVVTHPEFTKWTEGFGAVLAVFLPAAFGWFCAGNGLSWWRGRHPEV